MAVPFPSVGAKLLRGPESQLSVLPNTVFTVMAGSTDFPALHRLARETQVLTLGQFTSEMVWPFL